MGTVIASCGCRLKDGEETVNIRFGGSDCDAIDGFQPCIIYASYCPACADKAKSWPEFLPDGVSDEWWLSEGYEKWLSQST